MTNRHEYYNFKTSGCDSEKSQLVTYMKFESHGIWSVNGCPMVPLKSIHDSSVHCNVALNAAPTLACFFYHFSHLADG